MRVGDHKVVHIIIIMDGRGALVPALYNFGNAKNEMLSRIELEYIRVIVMVQRLEQCAIVQQGYNLDEARPSQFVRSCSTLSQEEERDVGDIGIDTGQRSRQLDICGIAGRDCRAVFTAR